MVVDMEASCYLLKELRNALQTKMVSIKNPQPSIILPPKKETVVFPEKPKELDNHVEKSALEWSCQAFLNMIQGFSLGVFFILSFPILFFWFWMFLLGLAEDILFWVLSSGDVSAGLAKGVLIETIDNLKPVFFWASKYVGIPGAILGLVNCHNDFSKYRKEGQECRLLAQEYQRRLQEYHRESQTNEQNYQMKMNTYNADCEREERRVKEMTRQNEKKRLLIGEKLNKVNASIRQSSDCLQELYRRNIIFPKYRNLVMVCSLHEYICAGRCSTLEGRDGAYNILEAEMRVDHIITQLDHVITQLNAIQRNQYELYTVLQSNREIMNRILASNQRILDRLDVEGDCDVQADGIDSYCEGLSQKEKEYERRINDFR